MCPIIVHSCDNYSRFWPFWKSVFDLHCPSLLERVIFCNEKIELPFSGVKQFLTGTGSFTERLRTICNHFDGDIIYAQEDFWPTRPVDLEWLEYSYKFFKDNDLDCFKLLGDPNGHHLSFVNTVGFYHKDCNYIYSHNFGIWKTKSLVQLIQRNENPWQNESNTWKEIHKFSNMKILATINPMWYLHGISQGKLNPQGVEILTEVYRQNLLKMDGVGCTHEF